MLIYELYKFLNLQQAVNFYFRSKNVVCTYMVVKLR